jgi:hypothetical protein
MNARGLIATATLAGPVLFLTIILWSQRTVRSTTETNAPRANTSWTRARVLNSSIAVQLSGADVQSDGESSSDLPTDIGSQESSAPRSRALTMQNGTVIWAADRERAGNAPARER